MLYSARRIIFACLFSLSAIGGILFLSACGGGSSGDSGTSGEVLQGIFVDSAVVGVDYQTSPGNLSDVTGEGGTFNYKSGDEVTFSIGGIELGTGHIVTHIF